MSDVTLTLETVQWSSLKDIDDVAPIDGSDAVLLDEIRQVLINHGKLDRFGVCLLHKHFDLADDEIAIENTDHERRISTVSAEKSTPQNLNSIQTMWRFMDDGTSMGTKCTQRCAPGGTTHRLAHSSTSV